MPVLKALNGKNYDTKNVPIQYDPFFCNICGDRMGWTDCYNQGLGIGRTVCEDCIANMQEED